MALPYIPTQSNVPDVPVNEIPIPVGWIMPTNIYDSRDADITQLAPATPDIKYSPFATNFYLLPDFSFLNAKEQRWLNFQIPYSASNIFGHVTQDDEKIPISSYHFDQLQEVVSPSLVGIGNETVLNQEVRRSNDLWAEESEFEFEPSFRDWIQGTVDILAKQLNHPTAVKPKLHKLILYQAGDFFNEHIDSNHGHNLVMSLSVELPVDQAIMGGNLVIEGAEVPHAELNHINLTLFYHDAKHEVTRVESGKRIVLIFDVIQKKQIVPEVLAKYRETLARGLEQVKAKGIRQIGFLLNHLYINPDEKLEPKQLKGIDRVGYELLRELNLNVRIKELMYTKRRWYLSELMALIGFNKSFHTLHNDHEEDDEPKTKYLQDTEDEESYDDIRLSYDKSDKYAAVSKKFRLGGVLMLKTMGRSRKRFSPDDEIYLGNEGFDGETIYDNLAIIVDL